MSLYSDFAPRRVRQIAADILAAVVLIASIAAAAAVHGLISAFGKVWGRLEGVGSGFQQTMSDIGDDLRGVPLIGDGIRAPFEAASGAGGSLAEAGRAGKALIESIAVAAGLGVAAVPIALLLVAWLLPRMRFVRRAADTRALLALPDGEALLALRALQSASAAELTGVSPAPVHGWQERDPAVVRGLAALTGRRAGIRVA